MQAIRKKPVINAPDNTIHISRFLFICAVTFVIALSQEGKLNPKIYLGKRLEKIISKKISKFRNISSKSLFLIIL